METETLDGIRLLSDKVINLIAAGEVVQRPASALKELLENAADAGATLIRVQLKDAGRTLIEVVDNGCGIRAEQAEMALRRHATSKLVVLEDLHRLHTYGFRGEALASVAAVSVLELATRHRDQETGVLLECEGGDLKGRREAAMPVGTRVTVKSLFYNVPARRNFLKKDETEFRNLEDEFIRLALARPDLSLELHHQGRPVYQLRPATPRQRIQALLGKSFEEGLVPVDEETQLVRIHGFVAKPSICRKSRFAQYLLVNGRYVRDPYLQHAVTAAMEGLLAEGLHPAYILHLQVDASKVDVNVHPAKTEVKFEEDKAIYAILKAAVRRSLGQFQCSPSLDFDKDPLPDSWGIRATPSHSFQVPTLQVNKLYNPFDTLKAEVPPKVLNEAGPLPWTAAGPQSQVAEEEWDQDGWSFEEGRYAFRSPSRLMLVDAEALRRAIGMQRQVKAVDLQFRPGQGSLPLEDLSWSLPASVPFGDLASCAASMGIMLELEPTGSAANGPEQRLQVRALPAGASWNEARSLLEQMASLLSEGLTPERSTLVGYLASCRGIAGVHAPFESGNIRQIFQTMQNWLRDGNSITDSEGRPLAVILRPSHFFDNHPHTS